MSSIPHDVVDKVNGFVASEQLPILKKVALVFECLQENGLAYKTMAQPKDTLRHPSNRGGSLLNCTDVWAKGMRMVAIGVQPSLLQEGGAAFEMSTEMAQRQKQLQANEAVVGGSNGSLANVSQVERYLTAATSHTAAFCKAVGQGCKSPDGIAVGVNADGALKKLVAEGWPMVVISELVERRIPSLPAWLQMAMNAVNCGFKQVNEIEAAALMAELMKHGSSLKDALGQVERSDPLCKAQLPAIAYYVSRYGGGDQQGLIGFLNGWSALAFNHCGFASHHGFVCKVC